MGQKTDIKNIFQIGKNNKKYIWDSKYIEKKKNESSIFVFQSMEIKKFIEKIFKDNNLIMYKYRINFLESNIKIFISYLKLPKSQNIINKKKLKIIKEDQTPKSYKKNTRKILINKNKIKKKIKILKYYKYYIKIKNNKINNFLEKIIEGLNIFTNNKFNININLKQVNKELTFKTSLNQLQYLKKVIIQLRQFKKSKFFKEGINVIFLAMINKESSQLLSDFIANQLKLVKKHGFFLKFIKKTLSLILKSKLVRTKGIKIIIKGRFNGKSRSNKKIITINNNMPLMTIKSKVNSSQSTAYGPNGTFGVKVWVNEN